MADSGRHTRNYALRGRVKHLCDEYPTLESLHEALCKGTDDLWGNNISSEKIDRSEPHFQFLQALNNDECFRELDVVFEYVIPGTARRVDAIVFGETTRKVTDSNTKETHEAIKKYALIAEFKSWKEENWGEDGFESKYQEWDTRADGCLWAQPQESVSGFYPIEHPLLQALSYRNFLNNFHSAASADDWNIDGICYFSRVSDFKFLFSGKICSNLGFCRKVCKKSDDYIAVNSKDGESLNTVLAKRLKAEEGFDHSPVTRSDFACDEFLQGTYMVPLGTNKAGGILRRICLTSGGCYNEKGKEFRPDSRVNIFKSIFEHAFVNILESGLNGTIDDKRWLIIVNGQRLLASRTNDGDSLFINHADMAMGLQCALLQTGYPYISLQTNGDALNKMRDQLEITGKTVEYAFQPPPFNEISRFNVFNAYKWESGVYTTVGIVDLCEGKRGEAKEKEKLVSFLKNSVEAKTIFLLVDDGTESVKDLKDGEPIQGFTIVKWPTD